LNHGYYFFLPGFWVNADPAETFAALLDPCLCNVLDAAEAAAADVTLDGLRCDNAEPAAVFADLLELLSRKTLEAADAARELVFSLLFAMW